MNAPTEPGSGLGMIKIIVKTAITTLTKFLKNSDNRIKLLNVLLGKSKGCSVANLSGKSVNFPSFLGGLKNCFRKTPSCYMSMGGDIKDNLPSYRMAADHRDKQLAGLQAVAKL